MNCQVKMLRKLAIWKKNKIDPSVTANAPQKSLDILSIRILKHLIEIKENVNEHVLMLE